MTEDEVVVFEEATGVAMPWIFRRDEYIVGYRALQTDSKPPIAEVRVVRGSEPDDLVVELVTTDSEASIVDSARIEEIVVGAIAKLNECRGPAQVGRVGSAGTSMAGLVDDPQSSSDDDIVPLSRWHQRTTGFAVPEPLGHAAASFEGLPRVFIHDGREIDVVAEGRGDLDRFALIVSDTSGVDGYVAVWFDPRARVPSLVMPLLVDDDGRRTASVWCDYPRGRVVIGRVNREDLDDREMIPAITQGVRASDGLTLRSWRAAARGAGVGSALYAAVIGGLQ